MAENMAQPNRVIASKIVFLILLACSAIPVVTPPVALFAGILFALFFRPVFPAFTKKTQKYLLQGCVVGLGFGMNVQEALRSGGRGMCFTIVSVAFVMCLGWLVGRLLKVDGKSSYLISSGTAICGGSAIAAVAPLVDAEDRQMTVSLGTIFTLNAIALFLFPPLGHLLGLTDIQFGEWAAIAIHDTSSVVGAGAAYSDKALEVATLVKCTRALWILPLALVTMAVWRRRGSRVAVPWFIFLFALAMVLNTYCGFPKGLTGGIASVAKQGFAVTLFLIGTGLTPKVLKSCGFRPLVQGVVLWIAIGVTSLLAIMAAS